jgi:polar amino acid transport system substrate-binding protein
LKNISVLFIFLSNILLGEIVLTEEEKDFLREHPVIKVHMEENYPPFSFRVNGKFTGFSIDYANLVANRLGIVFEYSKNEPWNEAIEKLKEKKIDIIAQIINNEERREFAVFTDNYMSYYQSIVVRQENSQLNRINKLEGKTVGAVKGYATADLLKKHYLNIEFKFYLDTKELILAVMGGEIDCAISTHQVVQYDILSNYINDVISIPITDNKHIPQIHEAYGIRDDYKLLRSAIRKAFDDIEDRKRELQIKWFGTNSYNKKYINNKIVLTPEEKEFLKNHPEIVLGTGDSWEPYSVKREDGTIVGYDQDVLDEINRVTGANFRLQLGDWSKMQDLAKSRELDGLATLIVTDEREKFFNFSDRYIKLLRNIYVKQGNPKNIRSLKDLEGKTVAIHKGNIADERFAKSIKNAKIIYFPTPIFTLKGVIYGEADATIGNGATEYMMAKEGLPYLTNAFALDYSLDLHFAIRKDWSEAISIFNKGLNAIPKERLISLQSKWFNQKDSSNKNLLNLTSEERQYLYKKGVIPYCIDPSWEPFEYLDKEGKHNGITKDYLEIVVKKLGVKVQLVKTESWSETIEFLKDRKCDMILEIAPTPSREKYLLFTHPYLNFPQVVVTDINRPFISSMNDILDKRVGIIKDYAIAEILTIKYPSFKHIEVKNTKDGLEKVARGDIDAFIDFLPPVSRGINQVALGNLKIGGKIDENVWLGAASRSDEPILHSILEKAVQSIEPEEHKAILDKWLTVKFEHGTDYSLVWKIVIGAFIIISAFSYWTRRVTLIKKDLEESNALLREAKTELEKSAVTDHLTKLYNRNRLDEVLISEFDRSNRFEYSFGVILIDIDHFKSVNDTYGHQMGDIVLIEFADILQAHSRKTDTVGRWGGEEFLIICSDSELDEILTLAEKLREEISQFPFTLKEQKTASFGVSTYKKDEKIDDMLKRADDALYSAKRKGRNTVQYL